MTQPEVLLPDAPVVDNSNPGPDTPLFGVNIGPTEITIFLTLLASVLTLVFHNDWGLSKHIQDIAAQAVYILPIALGLFRSFKHFVATNNNAKVVVAQVTAVAAVQTAQTTGTVVGSTTTPGVVLAPTGPDTPPADTSIPDDIPVAPTA